MNDYRNPSKIRKRYFSGSVHDNNGENSDTRLDDRVIQRIKFISNEEDIVLDRKVYYIYTSNKCNEYDKESLYSQNFWHQVTIHHNSQANPNEIIKALNKMVDGYYFVPIGYRSGKKESNFFVHNQSDAIEILLKKNLILSINAKEIHMTLRLCVAKYHAKQLNPLEKVENAIQNSLLNMKNHKLNLSNFNHTQEMADMKFSLFNKENFEKFCICVVNVLNFKINTSLMSLKILILIKNDIKSLSPLAQLKNCSTLINISLEDNVIESIQEFEYLKTLNHLNHLSIKGNPIANKNSSFNIHEQLMLILPSLKTTDVQMKPPPQFELATNSAEICNLPIIQIREVIRAQDITDSIKRDFPRGETSLKTSWSQVIIEHDGKYNGKVVLNQLFLEYFYETQCYPCYYKSGEKEDSFLLYMNFEPLNILVQNNLQIIMPDEGTVTLRLNLKAALFHELHLKWYDVISNVIKKRTVSRKLNLKNIQGDHDLKDLIVNLSSSEVLEFILDCACKNEPYISEIDLSENNIISNQGFSYLNLENFPGLLTLNVSHNKIENLIHFKKGLKITDLFMDRNPFCDQFHKATQKYVGGLLLIFPSLQKLDGRKIERDLKLVHLQNYYTTSIAYNSIENFINFFFQNYDDKDSRKHLAVLYNKKSIFTAKTHSGNKALTNELYGQAKITEFFNSFESMEHDYVTMTVDTPLYTAATKNDQNIYKDSRILIVVRGFFRMKNETYSFARNFLLRSFQTDKNNERTYGTLSYNFNYEIYNDQLCYNVIDYHLKNVVFKKMPATAEEIEEAYQGKFSNEEKLNSLSKLFEQVTNLKPEWCKRFLQDANGNFKEALQLYLKFYELRIFQSKDFLPFNQVLRKP